MTFPSSDEDVNTIHGYGRLSSKIKIFNISSIMLRNDCLLINVIQASVLYKPVYENLFPKIVAH